jgi:hypothetical protein
MASVSREPIGDYLTIINGLKNDRTRAVMESMLGHLSQIHEFVVSPSGKPAFEAWTRQLLQPVARELGTTAKADDTDERRQLRAVVFRTLGSVGNDPEAIAAARATTQAYMKDPSSVDSTILPNAVAIAAIHGDATLYDQFREHMKTARTPDEYYVYLRNLANFADPALVKRTAELFLTPEIKGQDVFQVFGILGNPETQKVAWDFFKTHFKEFEEKLGPGLGGGLANVASMFCDPQLRDDSQSFFKSQQIPGTERELANGLERVNACIDFRSQQQGNLDSYLKAAK